jgi:hypothetical protein
MTQDYGEQLSGPFSASPMTGEPVRAPHISWWINDSEHEYTIREYDPPDEVIQHAVLEIMCYGQETPEHDELVKLVSRWYGWPQEA